MHEAIKHDCPKANGLLTTWKIILPTMLRQLKYHTHYIHQVLPPGAGAPNFGPRAQH